MRVENSNDAASFIIRIWKETEDADGNVLLWRGVIERVGHNQRVYFQELSSIPRYIGERMGITDDSLGIRLRSWKNRWLHGRHTGRLKEQSR